MFLPSTACRRLAAYAAASTLAAAHFSQASAETATVVLPEVVVQTGASNRRAETGVPTPTSVTAAPAGQVQTVIGDDRTIDTRAFSAADLLIDSPGVTVKQGNGPRDFGISIRGSNARNGFGIRNIVIFDDGFPLTQPDGLSRSDLIDPHAYVGVDVIRGPSSALYGNYATGGAIDFHTFPGGALDGLVAGTDAGSYGYLNNYLLYGRKSGPVEASVFVSNVKGNALTSHSGFDTQTVNALLRYQLTPEDRVTVKVIENHLRADLSNRLSFNQFFLNPYQRGCATAVGSAPGCQSIAVLANGFNGTRVMQSADEGRFGRNDNRAIFGARYEHDFGTTATWRTQVTYDDRNINQPTGNMSSLGDYPSVNVISDVVARGQLFGRDSTSYAALYANTLSTTALTYNVAPGGSIGGLYQVVPSTQTNAGGRVREELKLTDTLLLVAGVGVEKSFLQGRSTSFTYAAPDVVASAPVIGANRAFLNTAPELSLTYRPATPWTITGRVATGYGTPNVSNLFVNSSGVAGNNTDLKSQTNLGYDLAVGYSPLPLLTFTVDGFYEFFRNELVNQSAGPNALTYTFNAPRSEHRGVEVGAKWAFASGFLLTAAYTYDNQIYTQYTERLSAGAFSSAFDRVGNRIPGVPLNELLLRLGYDQPAGAFKGLGAYVEYVNQDDFYVDNANLLKAPGFGLVNVNLHYVTPLAAGPFRDVSAYVEVRNVADRTYLASANNITDSISATTGRQNGAATVAGVAGSIYAGTPRTVYGGVRLRF